MNKIYKVIWSHVKQCYVVTSELAKAHGRTSTRGRTSRLAVAALTAFILTAGVTSVGLADTVTDNNDNTITSTDSKKLRNLTRILLARIIKSLIAAMQRLSVMVIRLRMKQKATIIASDMSEAMMRVFMVRGILSLPAVINRSLVIITRLLAEMTERSQIISTRKDENPMYQI